MKLLDGKAIAQEIRNEIKYEIQKAKAIYNKVPGLAAILVGDNPASKVYVNMKSKACNEVGIYSVIERLPADISEDDLLDVVDKYNVNDNIHGILVQLPLPLKINQDKILNKISIQKDVDGFNPYNVGNLMIGNDTFYPCTPYGIVELLMRYKINTNGKHVVVLGRSNIVGKPIANMLLQKKENANATVTICHSGSSDLKKLTTQADILIAAIGKPEFIDADMVKDGAVVIDVGINRVEDNSEKGYKIVGDVNFYSVSQKASYITPVPGGVGPLTIAMLLKNTMKAFNKLMV